MCKSVKYIYWVKKDLFGCFKIEEIVTKTQWNRFEGERWNRNLPHQQHRSGDLLHLYQHTTNADLSSTLYQGRSTNIDCVKYTYNQKV